MTVEPLPTRNKAHAYLNHLRDIRGDLCIDSCTHSVATNTAEHCLEAYVSGRLIDGQAIADAPKCEHGNIYRHIMDCTIRHQPLAGITKWEWCEGSPEAADLLGALTEENNDAS